MFLATTLSTPRRSRLGSKINHFNDTIFSIYNTIVGGLIGGFSNDVPDQIANHAMDGILGTKYYNGRGTNTVNKGINTGFIVTPLTHQHTIACALRFATGNDAPERDPLTVTLEGSNGTNTEQFNSTSAWTLIYNGTTGINDTHIHPWSTYASEQYFDNRHSFISYRLLVTSKRNVSNGVQYSEAEIYNCF